MCGDAYIGPGVGPMRVARCFPAAPRWASQRGVRSVLRTSRSIVGAALLLNLASCDPPDGTGVLPKQTVALPGGVTLAYVELGAPSGEPVIFLHGYTDTARSFYPTALHLAEAEPGWRILVVDQRGHGDTSMPPAETCAAAPESCFRPIDMADDVVAFMDALGLEQAAVVGHSMGSFVAQELALTYPERVERMVLIGTGVRLAGNVVLQQYVLDEPVEGSWKAGFVADGLEFPGDVYTRVPAEGDPAAEAWISSSWVVEPAADPAFLAAVVPETAATRMGTWIGAARALLATDHAARLEDLAVPTMILWATQDVIFSAAEQDELLARLDVAAASCASSYVFKTYGQRPLPEDGIGDDIGHNTQWAIPKAVARDIDAYLRSGEPTADQVHAAADDPQEIVVVPGAAMLRRSTPCEDD